MKNTRQKGMQLPPGTVKTASTAFMVGACEIAGMFAAIQILQHRKQIAERVRFEIKFWRDERKRFITTHLWIRDR